MQINTKGNPKEDKGHARCPELVASIWCCHFNNKTEFNDRIAVGIRFTINNKNQIAQGSSGKAKGGAIVTTRVSYDSYY